MPHYCTPKKAQKLGLSLFAAAKEGALVYASAHTDLFFPTVENNRVFECYKTQYEQGKKFPGWMMLNTLARIQGKHTYDSVFFQAWPLDEDNDEIPPVQQKAGWHKEASQATIMKISDNDFRTMSHQSYLIYDIVSLKALFERSGFIIEDAFFLNKYEERLEIGSVGTGNGRFTSAQDTQKACRACVIARKPNF